MAVSKYAPRSKPIKYQCRQKYCYHVSFFIQAKSKERQWLKHQMTGELDDMKLIEGLTGEKNIYKRRAEQEPEVWRFSILIYVGFAEVVVAVPDFNHEICDFAFAVIIMFRVYTFTHLFILFT